MVKQDILVNAFAFGGVQADLPSTEEVEGVTKSPRLSVLQRLPQLFVSRFPDLVVQVGQDQVANETILAFARATKSPFPFDEGDD